jgi:hypothetical protein
MKQVSQELPDHVVLVEVLRHHFVIVPKALGLLVLIQVHCENDQQRVQHQLASDVHRELKLKPT